MILERERTEGTTGRRQKNNKREGRSMTENMKE